MTFELPPGLELGDAVIVLSDPIGGDRYGGRMFFGGGRKASVLLTIRVEHFLEDKADASAASS